MFMKTQFVWGGKISVIILIIDIIPWVWVNVYDEMMGTFTDRLTYK